MKSAPTEYSKMSRRKTKKNDAPQEESYVAAMPFRDAYRISHKTLKRWAATAETWQQRRVFIGMLRRSN